MNNELTLAVLATVVVNLFTLLTVLANGWLTAKKAEQTRRWEIEDRRALAHDLAERTDVAARGLAANLKQDANDTREISRALAAKVAALSLHADAAKREVMDAISENTGKTEEAAREATRAYTEANHVNLKIEKLGLAHQQHRRVTDPNASI